MNRNAPLKASNFGEGGVKTRISLDSGWPGAHYWTVNFSSFLHLSNEISGPYHFMYVVQGVIMRAWAQ